MADLDARLRQVEQAGSEFRETLNRLGDALVDTHDRQAIVTAVLDSGALYLQATAGAFYLVATGRDVLRPTAYCGRADAGQVGEMAIGEGVAGRAALTGSVVVWPGDDLALTGPSPAEPRPLSQTALAVPVRVRGRSYGVLALYGRSVPTPFSRADVETLAALVRQVEPAIENTYLYEEAQRLAITDGLTSLWNRRQFDLRTRSELQRAQRFGDPFAMVLVDIDEFKGVNDELGHQAGDSVLLEVARRLVSSVRDVDVVARVGGEEFGLVLPNTPLEGAVRLAERVRTAVGAEPFEVGGRSLAVTISAGIATWPEHGSTGPELYAAADAALYRAKAAGRNQVASASLVARDPQTGASPEPGESA